MFVCADDFIAAVRAKMPIGADFKAAILAGIDSGDDRYHLSFRYFETTGVYLFQVSR